MIATTFDLGSIITFITNGILQIWNFMSNIEFLGTNLLKFSLTLFILSIMLPILFTIARSMGYKTSKEIRVKERR